MDFGIIVIILVCCYVGYGILMLIDEIDHKKK